MPINCCPHCGSREGIYTKTTYRNVIHYQGFYGEERDNNSMHDVASVEGGKIAYCQDCNKQICRMSTLERQWRNHRRERS